MKSKKKAVTKYCREREDGTTKNPLTAGRMLIFKDFMIVISPNLAHSNNRIGITSFKKSGARIAGSKMPYSCVNVDVGKEGVRVWANDVKSVKCTQGWKA